MRNPNRYPSRTWHAMLMGPRTRMATLGAAAAVASWIAAAVAADAVAAAESAVEHLDDALAAVDAVLRVDQRGDGDALLDQTGAGGPVLARAVEGESEHVSHRLWLTHDVVDAAGLFVF